MKKNWLTGVVSQFFFKELLRQMGTERAVQPVQIIGAVDAAGTGTIAVEAEGGYTGEMCQKV